MKPALYCSILLFTFFQINASNFEKDFFTTSEGELEITFIGHGTLLMTFNGKVIHIDPVSRYADYTKLPKADLILITHEHGDHLDPKAIETIEKQNTQIVLTDICNQKIEGTAILKNGESGSFAGIEVAAVPAYNIKNERAPGMPFHPKGSGNGYVLTIANKKVYVAGDTENIPEMENLKNIDIAFLPMNLPYTMTPEMVVDACKMLQPKILYPYHFGDSNTNELKVLLEKNNLDTELRIRKLN